MSSNDGNVGGSNGDGSDLDIGPSCSNGRRRSTRQRASNNNNNNNENPGDKKKQRRVVMRIKYIDESSEQDTSEQEDNATKVEPRSTYHLRRRRRALVPLVSSESSDNETNIERLSTCEKECAVPDSTEVKEDIKIENVDSLKQEMELSIENVDSDANYNSDSSSNESLEKCPICLTTFRQQEIGTPAPCDHVFCATCIEAWSKNTSTCPIDRLNFEQIFVDRSYTNRERVRVIETVKEKEKVIEESEEYEYEDNFCPICHQADREEVMLLCDYCNQGYHMDCLTPALLEIPEGEWFCQNCDDGSLENRNLHSPNIEDIFAELDDELGLLVSRVSEVRVPRIARTLANERIRIRILNGINRTTTNTRRRRVTRRRRRRRQSARTFVVECEINEFDEKFALKTTKKVIRRRRRRRVNSNRRNDSARQTVRTRFAEQLGLPPRGGHRDLGGNTALSIFGNPNALEYFSDDEETTNIEQGTMEIGAGGAVQTRVRLANYMRGNSVERKNLLLGRRRPRTPPPTVGPVDLLGSIMSLQDRWHNAAQRIQDVRINQDGTLELPATNSTATTTTSSDKKPTVESVSQQGSKLTANNQQSPAIMEAPMYQRGGHNNFNRGGGGGARGNMAGGYNNRFGSNYGNNNNNNQYRNSNAGSLGNNAEGGGNTDDGDYNMNRGNFFPTAISHRGPQQQNMPFNIRFNQRNQQQQNNNTQQRHSLPFATPRQPNYNYNNSQIRIQPLFRQQEQNNNNRMMPDLFGGLPPPTTASAPPSQQQANNFPHISVPPPPTPPVGASFPWGPPTVAPASVFGPVRRTENNHDDAEHNNSECPNYAVYSTFSKENLQAEGEKNGHKNNENEINQEDDEKEEDLVQLDDDEEDAVNDGGNLANENIPLPPNETHAIDNNNLYEPENPTEEDDDIEESTHHENADEEDEKEQQEIEESAQHEEENINKSDAEMDDEEAQTIELGTSACKTADDGDDDDNGDGDDSSDSESDTEKQNKTSENATDKNANISPTNNQNDIEKKTTNNRKGVLELYDDSDWEELDIDKPQESAIVTATTNDIQNAIIEPQVDRSFTPCLDEPVENEIENLSLDEPVSVVAANVANIVPPDTNALGTELISEEELHTKPVNKKMGSKSKSRSKSRAKSRGRRRSRSRSRSRSMRRSSAERFKKISRRQKERNYRGISDQKQSKRGGARNERRRSIATRSRSRTRSPIRFRTRSRSRSLRRQQLRRTRSRTRSRSPILRHRFSRSPRKRTRSRSLNRRGRVLRSRSRPLRSRSRSRSMHNNKENNRHKNNSNSKRDEDKSSRNNTSNRPKRRELPRYDVRNVIGNQNQRLPKDRYGRDTLRAQSRSVSRNRQFIHARSFSRTPRSRTPSPQRPQRIRRASFSMSPTPSPPPQHYNQHGGNISPLPHYQSPTGRARYLSPSPITARLNGRRNLPREQSHSPAARTTHMQRSRTPSMLRISQANNISLRKSRSLSARAERMRNRRKRSKERKKKRSEKKARGNSLIRAPSPDEQNFEIEKVAKKKRRHSTLNKHWSPTSPETANVATHEALGWTPPPREDEHILTAVRRSLSVENTNDFDKHKRQKKKHKTKDKRKEKRRKARTASNEPPPSKEVFASGNNILVSVSFNKDKNTSANAGNVNNMPQSTVVTLPSHREDIRGQRRRRSDDNGKKQHGEEHNGASKKRDKTHKRRTKTDAKPVAIIDLERSPFQVQQDLMDVIVLTDSEDANEKDTAKSQRRQSLMSTSADGEEEQQQQQKTVDNNEALESMDEETSTNVLTTGPKTPPEPHLVKFNIQNKKTLNARSVLHDDVSDATSDDEQTQCREEVQHRESVATPLNEQTTNANKMAASDNMSDSVVSVSQKIGPNTPPESAPCSPDVYDPFDPTKSPSISPSSPTPSNSAQTTLNDISTDNVSTANVDLNKNVEQQQQLVSSTNSGVPSHITNTAATQTSLNAADLVLAFINNKNSNTNNEATLIPGVGDDVISNSNKHETANDIVSGGLQVLSNVLLRSPVGPTILGLGNKLTQLPALGGSVGSSSSGILATAQNISNNNNNTSSNLDDSFNIADFDSPYSPGSADYEDLFEPPPDSTKQRAAAGNTVKRGKADVFDNLFGSSSPPPRQSIPNVFLTSTQRKPGNLPGRSKSNKSKDHKSYDDVPSSAVDLNIKDKLLRKLNRQERVVEEVKLVLKPRFNKKQISKEDYKEIMRRAVPKICHSKSGEINPRKIKNLIEAYVKKFRAKHKKLNLLNTGQVSSAVKCAAYLKKL